MRTAPAAAPIDGADAGAPVGPAIAASGTRVPTIAERTSALTALHRLVMVRFSMAFVISVLGSCRER